MQPLSSCQIGGVHFSWVNSGKLRLVFLWMVDKITPRQKLWHTNTRQKLQVTNNDILKKCTRRYRNKEINATCDEDLPVAWGIWQPDTLPPPLWICSGSCTFFRRSCEHRCHLWQEQTYVSDKFRSHQFKIIPKGKINVTKLIWSKYFQSRAGKCDLNDKINEFVGGGFFHTKSDFWCSLILPFFS